MIYSVVLVSHVQQSDSGIHIHVSVLFQILFSFRLLQSIEQSSLCYTVGPVDCLFYIVVCIICYIYMLLSIIYSSIYYCIVVCIY